MTIEREIRDCYKRMGIELAVHNSWPYNQNKWIAQSQYGFCISDPFDTKEEAEQFVIDYYCDRMHFIRQ